MRGRWVIAAACILPAVVAAQSVPPDLFGAERWKLFGITVGAQLDEATVRLTPTAAPGEYVVTFQSPAQPFGAVRARVLDQSRRVAMLNAVAQFQSAGECASDAAAMRESVAARWQLKFKPSPDNGWYASAGTSELDLVCTDTSLHLDVRDLSALRAQSAELQGYTTSITCDSATGMQAGAERAGSAPESFAPVREVSYSEARIPLQRIAQRLQFFHGQLINRRRCLRQGQLRYTIVVDASGKVVDARLLDSSFTPSFLAVVEREIRRERFESEKTPGYRQIEFALTLRAQ